MEYTELQYLKIKRNLTQNNTLLISINGTLGNVAFFNNEKVALGKSACFLNFKEDVCRNYIRYVFETKEFKTYMNRVAGQSTIKNVSPTQISEYEFYAPSLPTQQKIAAVLSALDDKIALNRRINAKLEAMAKRLYDYWFVQFDFPGADGRPYKSSGGKMEYNATLGREIPAGWEIGKIGDFVKIITKGTTPSTAGFGFVESGVNFVKVECIENGHILTENLMHISEEANETLKRSQLQENDILVTIAGRLGTSAVVSNNILPANTNQAVGIIRLKDNFKFLANYLYERIISSDVQSHLQGANAQSIQKNLTLPNLADITFVYNKNFKILSAFNEKTLSIFNYQLSISKEIQKLTALRDYLLPLLMNGQVSVITNNVCEFCNAKLVKSAKADYMNGQVEVK